MRSNGKALSLRNVIEKNVVSTCALRTRDLGGLSFIGWGHTGTIVRENNARDMVGMDTNDKGELLRPFYTWSVDLDN